MLRSPGTLATNLKLHGRWVGVSASQVQFRCPCGETLTVPRSQAGGQIRCPHCGQTAPVPARQAEDGEAQTSEPEQVPAARFAGQVCSICQSAIGAGEVACRCPQCRSPYHRECWEEVGGCATYGCRLTPDAKGPSQTSQAPTSAWGDTKSCPSCRNQIQAGAIKCRHCNARFPSSTPMSSTEYKQWQDKQARLGPTRTGAIVFFCLSIIGFLAPLLLAGGFLWLLGAKERLDEAGGMHKLLFYFGLGISGIYSCFLFLILVTS